MSDRPPKGDLVLAMVTCGPQLEVALGGGNLRPPSAIRLAGPTLRSTLILAAVDLLMEDAAADPADLGRIAVTRGPGSFTGIRSGLATAQGMSAALGRPIIAMDSLFVQAARVVEGADEVWSAQPGRRGQVYAQRYRLGVDVAPVADGAVEVVDVGSAADRGPWVAAEKTDLGPGRRLAVGLMAVEALLRLVEAGVDGEPVAPKYVEGPPVDRPAGS
jgi:tRNA threonylcarbamoyladenosine biosynthesis protein TsaB